MQNMKILFFTYLLILLFLNEKNYQTLSNWESW